MNKEFEKQFAAYSIVIRSILANLEPEKIAQIKNTIKSDKEGSSEDLKEAFNYAVEIVESSAG